MRKALKVRKTWRSVQSVVGCFVHVKRVSANCDVSFWTKRCLGFASFNLVVLDHCCNAMNKTIRSAVICLKCDLWRFAKTF